MSSSSEYSDDQSDSDWELPSESMGESSDSERDEGQDDPLAETEDEEESPDIEFTNENVDILGDAHIFGVGADSYKWMPEIDSICMKVDHKLFFSKVVNGLVELSSRSMDFTSNNGLADAGRDSVLLIGAMGRLRIYALLTLPAHRENFGYALRYAVLD